jgi:hypothetical protein
MNSEVKSGFDLMGKEVQSILSKMSETTAGTIGNSTKRELESERGHIAADFETTLRENTSSLADLPAKVAPSTILSNNFMELISYARSATMNKSVVFANYLNTDGQPLTRYLDLKNIIIQKYLESGEGKTKIDKVLNASLKDNGVFIIDKPIEVEGKSLGKLVLGVDKSSMHGKSDAMSGRFTKFINENSASVRRVLDQESGKIIASMQIMLENINSKNVAASDNISSAIYDSGASQQAASIKETFSSLEEMSSMTRQNAETPARQTA